MVRMVFDFETTNHSYGSALDKRNRILMVAWRLDGHGTKNYTGDILGASRFWRDLHGADVLCAWNAKFEQHWLLRCGFDIDSKVWHDPMLAEKVLLGNRRDSVSLGATAERRGFKTKDPLIDSLMKAGVCPSDMPQRRLLARCRRDVAVTGKILAQQLTRLTECDSLHVYRNRCEFMTVLTHIEAAGMHLDADVVRSEYAKYSTEVGVLQAQLDSITGGINMRSPKQKGEFLYDTLKFPEKKRANGRPMRTTAGGRMTDKITMQWLAGQATTDKQEIFIEKSVALSKASAALSKNLEFFKGVCDEKDGHFHAQFNQTVAVTHRLTSSGIPLQFNQFDKAKSVQFQNMPRIFKGCFMAPEGYAIAEVDSMQLEFRVAAFLGNDRQALEDILDPDFDAHILSASKIFGLNYDVLLREYREGNPASADFRQQAKAHTFKPLFGGTRGTEGEERYYKYFAERYAGISATQEGWLAEVMANHGHLVTPWGMRFYFDFKIDRRGVAISKSTFKPIGPMVYNYPVQNLATAEIVPIAIVSLWKRCQKVGLKAVFVNTVHDSVICYIPDTHKARSWFLSAVELAFTTDVYDHLLDHYNLNFTVPLGVETVIGDHWGKGETTKYDDVINRRKEV